MKESENVKLINEEDNSDSLIGKEIRDVSENSQILGLTKSQLEKITQVERFCFDDSKRIFCDLCKNEIDLEKFYKNFSCCHQYHIKCSKKKLKREPTCPVISCSAEFEFN